MTFADTLRIAIAERFPEGKSFVAGDFRDIADKFDSHLNSVTNVFRELERQKKLRIVGEETRRKGGSPHKIYCIAANAEFAPKEKVNYIVAANRKESHLHECGKRLEAAMSNWK